jgi:hypothetical protein
MKSLVAVAVAVLSLCAFASAQDQSSYVQEHPLAAGATVVLTMNVGDVKILPSGSDRLRLEIHTNRAVDQQTMAGWLRRFEVATDRVTIQVHVPEPHDCDHCGSDVTLYVPERTDLKADLDVGDLTIRGIHGDKDAHTGVGDLRIVVDNPAEYGHVETHTRIGDVHDVLNQSGEPDGFLGKSEDFTLNGRYHLRASTGIGDVHISKDGKS